MNHQLLKHKLSIKKTAHSLRFMELRVFVEFNENFTLNSETKFYYMPNPTDLSTIIMNTGNRIK